MGVDGMVWPSGSSPIVRCCSYICAKGMVSLRVVGFVRLEQIVESHREDVDLMLL
jgi:hypothetical protein